VPFQPPYSSGVNGKLPPEPGFREPGGAIALLCIATFLVNRIIALDFWHDSPSEAGSKSPGLFAPTPCTLLITPSRHETGSPYPWRPQAGFPRALKCRRPISESSEIRPHHRHTGDLVLPSHASGRADGCPRNYASTTSIFYSWHKGLIPKHVGNPIASVRGLTSPNTEVCEAADS
jgi:hypothetical protein